MIQELNLENNRLGDAAVVELARGLTGHVGLRRVGLRKNAIGNDGALALAKVLKEQRRHSSAALDGVDGDPLLDAEVDLHTILGNGAYVVALLLLLLLHQPDPPPT